MYNDEDEEISKCCGMLAIAALFTAAILGAPWIIAFWVGSPVTSLFESVTKNATYTCIVNDKLPCGHEPVLSDWFLATLIQVIVASLEYFFWTEKKDRQSFPYYPIPYLSAGLHFSGFAPFFLTAYFSAIHTQHYEHSNTNALKWVKYYYIRFGIGSGFIFVAVAFGLLTRCLCTFDQNCPKTFMLLQQTLNGIKHAINHCYNTSANGLRYSITSARNSGHDVKNYLYALCCHGRARFENPANTGVINSEQGNIKKETIPPVDRFEIMAHTEEIFNDLGAAGNGDDQASSIPQPEQPPGPSFCRRLATFFRCGANPVAANVTPIATTATV